jgi:hypothetical protein
MSRKIHLAWVGALTLLPHLAFAAGGAGSWSIETAAPAGALVALADSLPTASVESICRDAQSAALPDAKTAAYQACVHAERAAYDQLRQKWAHYSAGARATCAEPGYGSQISYVELQTCLDMQPGGSLNLRGSGSGDAGSLDAIPSPTTAPRMSGQKN